LIKLYISHSIRGSKGIHATQEDMEKNCQIAREFGNWLRKNYPGIEFYVPADHEEFVRIAWMNNLLTEKEILSVDCEIILGCCGLIVYAPDGHISKGMTVELDYAKELEMATIQVKGTENFEIYSWLKGLGYNG
jgi:hypothetical protein